MPIHPNVRKCIHFKLDGKQCGSPAMSDKPYCFHHCEVVRRRRLRKLPFIKNAADLQIAVMDVIKGMLERRLCSSDANALLYALQLAQNNLRIGGLGAAAEAVEESQGSLIHQLLEEVDEVQVLEAEADIATEVAKREDFEQMMKTRIRPEDMPPKKMPTGS